ncbi:outer membrane protein Iml2/Tetratricopeptide repeat protein 39 [Elsinoe ampelina]|uniref:Inclusion body clearance protein IML2 n=1 Tax=Elsinoe ampelina TaxID=302913 RepID=A0A6A6GB36_9PEZI|nr:outer membrane protein Iml2/Tetratricopeptide repeat protein 39 [Elsinoe ampelina]
MASAALILNDEFEKAEEGLSKSHTPFHKLGRGVLSFLRAVIGFEQEIMKEASGHLGEAETAASEHRRKAYKEGYKSKIYPPGSEYALVYAESQLMSAVVGVLNESLTEAIKGFYRLRQAYTTLQEIADAEKRYLKGRSAASIASTSSASRQSTDFRQSTTSKPDLLSPASTKSHRLSSASSVRASSPLSTTQATSKDDDDDSDLDFIDAADDLDASSQSQGYKGNLTSPMSNLTIAESQPLDLTKLSTDELTNPIDLFIHTGTSLCFGLLQLLLSLVPPTFSRLLSIVGFRGDRDNGLKLLWSATEHPENINGALAGLIVLGYYSNMVNFVDIIDHNAYPRQQCQELLLRMRQKYPGSRFWLLEESRMIAGERRPEAAIALLLAQKEPAPLKQIEALKWFECGLNYMYTGEWEKCAEAFIKCVDLNNWSQALYYYIAGACYLELYREAVTPGSSTPTTTTHLATKYKSRATELLLLAPTKSGKKKFMARQLPFDVYVSRKIAKWQAVSQKKGVDLVDAAGVSPISEMVYFWSGWKRMGTEHLEAYLARLERWEEGLQESGKWEELEQDEKLTYHLLGAVVLERLGKREDARELLELGVTSMDLAAFKSRLGSHGEAWVLPVGVYELSVCDWGDYLELKDKGGDEERAQALLKDCVKKIDQVARWSESYDLDTRIGLKIRGAQETLRQHGAF